MWTFIFSTEFLQVMAMVDMVTVAMVVDMGMAVVMDTVDMAVDMDTDMEVDMDMEDMVVDMDMAVDTDMEDMVVDMDTVDMVTADMDMVDMAATDTKLRWGVLVNECMFHWNATKFIGSLPYPNPEGPNPRTLYLITNKNVYLGGCLPGGCLLGGVCLPGAGVCLPAGGVCPGGVCPGGVSAQGGVCPGGIGPGVCLPGVSGKHPHCGQNDIHLWKHYLAATTLWTVKRLVWTKEPFC